MTSPQEIFLIRLRRQRQHARVPIQEIADRLRIRPGLIEAFEQNDLSRWPRGVQARAWVRGYAETVELDPDDTVEEFCRLFPEGDRRSASTLQAIAAIAGEDSGYRDHFDGDGRRSTDPEPEDGWPAEVDRLGRTMWDRLNAPLKLRRRPRTEP